MNALLLNDEPFVQALRSMVTELREGAAETIAHKLECFKQKVKMKAIERSCCLKFESGMKEKGLRTLS